MPKTKKILSPLTFGISEAIRRLLLGGIWLYQRLISPLLGSNCRYYPSCSAYAHTCLSTMSLKQAVVKTTHRLSRCHPGQPGGVDLP